MFAGASKYIKILLIFLITQMVVEFPRVLLFLTVRSIYVLALELRPD